MGWQQPAKPVPAQLRLTQVAARPLLMYLMIQRHLRLLMCLPPTSQHVVASLLDTGLDLPLDSTQKTGRSHVVQRTRPPAGLQKVFIFMSTFFAFCLQYQYLGMLRPRIIFNCKVRSMYRSPLSYSTEGDTFCIDYMQGKEAASREQACARQRGDRHTWKIATA